MKSYQFEYIMSIQFTAYVEEHHFSMKCMPFYDQRQKYYKLALQVHPFCSTWKTKDGYGNTIISGYCKPLHNQFEAVVTGFAEINNTNQLSDPSMPIYRFPSQFTQPGAFIQELTTNLPEPNQHREYVSLMMDQIHSHLEYKKEATTTLTTAEEAYALKQGVCQDYAHLFLAVLRSKGIMSRYVAGLVEGEGETHAWVEVYLDHQWIGYDPTRNILVDDAYLKLSHGRDAQDCLVNRGIFVGDVLQTLHIATKMTRIQ